MTRKLTALVAAVALVALAGCGKVKQAGDRTTAMNALKALSLDYSGYQDSNGKPPSSAAELTAFWQKMGQPSLRKGELDKLTVVWGAKFGGTRVLAWHPPIGGSVPVMMQDGSVKLLSESEFAAAPKAETVAKP